VTEPAPGEASTTAPTIRPFRPTDAEGVTRLVRLVYDDTYHPRDLYDAATIVRRNEIGTLASIVAVDRADGIVGHYALERPEFDAVAEASDAIVLPERRHHRLMEQMRDLLRETGTQLGLTGLVGYPVTNHTFSQDAEERFGAHPCGVALGLWPRSYHNMPEPLTQRMSFVIYFQFLRPVGPVVHQATRHAEMLSRVHRQFGVTVERREEPPAGGAGEVSVEYEAAVGAGTIRVRRIGDDTISAVRRACRDLCQNSGAKAVTLELPLAQPGVAEACRAAEDGGFFFSGLGPAFAGDGDALLLQFPREDCDESMLRIDHPFAHEFLRYAAAERTQVRGGGWRRSAWGGE
jgi:hypothetical protein